MKKVLFVLPLLSLAAFSQTINPNQIRPSTTDNWVLTTIGGVTVWARSIGGCTLSDCVITDPTGTQTIVQPAGTNLDIEGELKITDGISSNRGTLRFLGSGGIQEVVGDRSIQIINNDVHNTGTSIFEQNNGSGGYEMQSNAGSLIIQNNFPGEKVWIQNNTSRAANPFGIIMDSRAGIDIEQNPITFEYTDGSPGATAHLLMCLDSAGKAEDCGAGTATWSGITTNSSPNLLDEVVAVYGMAVCAFDNTPVDGDFVVPSTTGAQCHDAGPALPSGSPIIGQNIFNSSFGSTATVLLWPIGQAAGGGGGGSGTVTSFAAPSGSWPAWLIPTVTTATTTPSLAVAASSIPNSALANTSVTVNGTTCTLGSSCTPSGGSVTSFSSGNLSPLFTTSVATATSTPALSFTLSSAAQNSVLAGPAAGGAGAPSYQTAPTISAANMTSFPTLNQNTTGNAATATALAATPSQCTGSQFATGVAANGNANCGTPAGSGTVNSGTAFSPAYYPTGGGTQVSGVTPFNGLSWFSSTVAPAAATAAQVVGVIGSTAVTNATNVIGGALGSAPYQSAANTSTFIASPTTSGHTFAYAWQPAGSAIAPVALDLATWFSGLIINATQVNGAVVPTSAKALASNASNQIIAATLAGSGAGLTTGPTTSVSGDISTFTGTAGQVADSGTLLSSLAPKASPTFTGTVTSPLTTAGIVTTTSGGVLGSEAQATAAQGGTGISTAASTGVPQVTSGTWTVSSALPSGLSATNMTLTTPALGTPSSAVLTNATGLPLTTGVTGVMPSSNGGTGEAGTITGVLMGNGTSAYTAATVSNMVTALHNDTAILTIGPSPVVGTSPSSIVCVTGFTCSSTQGEAVFTTGTGSLTTGNFMFITVPARPSNLVCIISLELGTGVPFPNVGSNSATTTSSNFSTFTALSASTQYAILWSCP